MPHHAANRKSRSLFWIVLTFLTGCAIVTILVYAAERVEIRDRIVMRRIWLNQSLGHVDIALKDLLSLKQRMITDAEWRERMLHTSHGSGDSKMLTQLALELEAKGLADLEWQWNGWVELVKRGEDSKGDVLLRKLEQPDYRMRLSWQQRLILSGYEKKVAGDLDAAIADLTRARDETNELSFTSCLLAEIQMLKGNWAQAEKELLRVNRFYVPMRAILDDSVFLMSKGRSTITRGALDHYHHEVGGTDPRMEELFSAIIEQTPDPAAGRALLADWRKNRDLPDDVSSVPPDWSKAQYPPLPSGEVVMEIPPTILKDEQGVVERVIAPLPAKALHTLIDLKKGTYTLVIRGASNRFAGRGGMLGIRCSSLWEGYTYLPDRSPVDRRISFDVENGQQKIVIMGPPLQKTGNCRSFFWLDRIYLIRRTTPPDFADSGGRDFNILPKAGMTNPYYMAK